MRIAGLLILFVCASAQAARYYVDANRGDDANNGTTPQAAWRTLEKVNATILGPGDRVLFRAGVVWRGTLAPQGEGAPGQPAVIGRHGEGAMPRIEGTGEDAVLLRNVRHFELRDLELTNRGDGKSVRRGVHLHLDNFGTARDILVTGLYIHDVNGTNERKDNGGIIFRTTGNTVPSRFHGLTIERNIIWRVDRSAIAAQSYHWPRHRWFPSLRVVIRENYAQDIGGDGIVPWAGDGAVVEHNIVKDANMRSGVYNAGIWPWSCDNTTLRWNRATGVRTLKDGQGFDSDYNSRNTRFEYNYSHDNEGGFLLICSPGKRNPKENLGNIGTVVRRNIRRNDRARIFHISAVNDVVIEENIVYIGENLDVQMALMSDWTGWASGVVFRNNIFHSLGTARYGHASSRAEDGSYGIVPGWGQAHNITFQDNRYIGRHIDAPEQAAADWQPPRVDWDPPAFDPARPEQLDAFLKAHRAWMERLMKAHFPPSARIPSRDQRERSSAN